MTTTARDVRLAARAAMLAREKAGDRLELLYVAVVRAHEDGVPVAEIADAARLSRQRIHQILDENRAPALTPPETVAASR